MSEGSWESVGRPQTPHGVLLKQYQVFLFSMRRLDGNYYYFAQGPRCTPLSILGILIWKGDSKEPIQKHHHNLNIRTRAGPTVSLELFLPFFYIVTRRTRSDVLTLNKLSE